MILFASMQLNPYLNLDSSSEILVKLKTLSVDVVREYFLKGESILKKSRGFLQIFSSKEEGTEGVEENKSKGNQAKELLAKYGGAYLATSITLSLISFSLCYALISAGIDVQALLQRVSVDVIASM